MNSKSKAFTLIEVMVAISVMLIGIVGLYALVPKVVSITGANNNKFTASQLAREGIEIVRNIRDTNWLEGENWQEGLDSGNWRAQYDKEFLLSFSDEPLKINGNGFYNYESGETTKFKRKLSLSYPEADVLNIKVQVIWSGEGSPFEVEENLYDWR